MTMKTQKRAFPAAAMAGLLFLTACGPRLAPVMRQGEIVPTRSDAIVEQARVNGEIERERLAEQAGATAAAALATCAPAICEAITRGEVAVGMTEAQVLAATRTTAHAWDTRFGGGVTLMTARPGEVAPRDAVGQIAFVNLQNDRVAGYTYRESHGFRTVSSPADATLAGRASARADALIAEGDELAAVGRLDLALDRYDRADVIRPGHAETNFRIASTLDKQLRPIEAILRYQLFLHQMELEKIQARGEAAARMAEAIALAQQRIIVLDRR
jgi:tetratricopeptide (TPR) repeat protein